MAREKKLYTQTEFDAMQRSGYAAGVADTEAKYRQIKVEQVNAVNKLIEESGRVLSRAGYLLGKLNGDNSR